mmetsp:Transcript_34655/g.53029  ORF Transcript_34655/g.53029 Transcript_34655/m.53029 type:complete len:87 (+) Transcript_34655:1143-1403(+)
MCKEQKLRITYYVPTYKDVRNQMIGKDFLLNTLDLGRSTQLKKRVRFFKLRNEEDQVNKFFMAVETVDEIASLRKMEDQLISKSSS